MRLMLARANQQGRSAEIRTAEDAAPAQEVAPIAPTAPEPEAQPESALGAKNDAGAGAPLVVVERAADADTTDADGKEAAPAAAGAADAREPADRPAVDTASPIRPKARRTTASKADTTLAVDRTAAAPFADDADLVPKSLNLAPAVLDAATDWLRQQRATHRRPRISWLVDAALTDLPTDVSALRALRDSYPAALYSSSPQQISQRIRRETVLRVEDAQFELSASRAKAPVLWQCLSAALARQIEAEGIDVLTRLDS